METTRRARRSWPDAIRRTLSRLYHRLVRLDDTPHSISMGMAVGLFVGMTPTYGFQVVLSVLVASYLRVNRLAGAIGCHITNPITALPAYWLTYVVGTWILRQPALTHEKFTATLKGVWSLPFFEAIGGFLHLGWSILAPLIVGGVVLGVLIGAASYPVTLILVKRYKEKRALRQARRKLKRREAQGEAGAVEEIPIDEAVESPTPKIVPEKGRNGNGSSRVTRENGAPGAGSGMEG